MKLLKLAPVLCSLLLVISVSIAPWQKCLAQEPDGKSSFALLPKGVIKSVPKTMEIYQYDDSPLGSRQPVLLIHGLLGEFHPHFRWDRLAEYLSQNKDFQKRYKIYMARYNSLLSSKEISNSFDDTLRKWAPPGGIKIIAISMAGNVIRNAMIEPTVNQHITRVITLGSFFRGSPLFCADWMKKTMLKRYVSPFAKLDKLVAYKFYFAQHKILLRDYPWDNSDGQMPPTKDIRPPKQTPQISEKDQLAIDGKFIVYTGYLHNQYAPNQQSVLRVILGSPFKFLKTTLPTHLERERPALRFLNDMIAGAIPKDPPHSDIIYPLNDGISPISSGLLLNDKFAARKDLNKLKEFGLIKANTNASKARIFDNIDHLTYIERHRPMGWSEKITDMISQTEEPRPMFDWILKDLME